MKSGSTKRSLLRLLILILTTVDQMMIVLAAHHGGHHHRASSRIDLSRAKKDATRFPCIRGPQSRAYNLRDLMQSVHPSESVNQPVYIVLERCDSHSGCCLSPDLSCAPKQSSIYYDEIEVEVCSLLTNKTRRVWIKVEQHGSCTCEINNASERLKADIRPPSVQIL